MGLLAKTAIDHAWGPAATRYPVIFR